MAPSRLITHLVRSLPIILIPLMGCATTGLKPMPERLAPEGQAAREYGWKYFVESRNTLSRQDLLDTLMMAQLWHSGVDRLNFVSEKDVGDVTVRMETHFRREFPAGDQFTVTFVDRKGAILLAESFTPAEIDQVIDDLIVKPQPVNDSAEPPLSDEALAELEEARRIRDARLARIAEVFPQPSEEADNAETP